MTIATGQSSGTGSIAIPVVDDAVDEPNETVSVAGTLRVDVLFQFDGFYSGFGGARDNSYGASVGLSARF